MGYMPLTNAREIAAMVKAIHASEDVVAAREKAIRVIERLHGFRLTRAAELAEAGVAETLTYYTFPEEHRRRIRTNDPLERLLREIRPTHACSRGIPRRPIGLEPRRPRLRHVAGTAWSSKRYLNIGSPFKPVTSAAPLKPKCNTISPFCLAALFQRPCPTSR
jgi:putative transposase